MSCKYGQVAQNGSSLAVRSVIRSRIVVIYAISDDRTFPNLRHARRQVPGSQDLLLCRCNRMSESHFEQHNGVWKKESNFVHTANVNGYKTKLKYMCISFSSR